MIYLSKAKFDLGNICMTSGIAELMEEGKITTNELESILQKHVNGDWGDLCEEDKLENEAALSTGESRLMSTYTINNIKIWIITEWDKSVTTILLPEEY